WMKAVSGEGQVLLVSGEPGIGKTRLVDELVAQSHVTGGRSLMGDSYAEGGPPYNPFRQIVRKAIGSDGRKIHQLPEDAMVSLLKLVPELRGDFPNLQVTETDDPRYEQQKLMESILFLFTSLCRESPVLLVLEDVHWADSGTISLLRYLGRETRQNRLLITATYREVELDEARPLHEMLMDFNREKIGRRIKLSRLDRQETEQMLEILFAEEIRPDFLEGIYRETEGNPFFIEEVAKALVESGKLTFKGGRWQRPSMAELGVPQSIQVAIQSRFQKLAEGTQKTLEQAAVLGRTFQTKTLLRATDQSEDELIEALEEAEHAQLIEALDTNRDEQFAFTHAMIPTALLSGIRRLRRRRLNRLAAQALEDLQPNEIESLANLYLEAGEIEKSLEYLLRVADRARAIYAYQEAIDGYEQALEILRDQDLERAARTLLKLGLAYHNASDFKSARGAYQEGFKLWKQAEDAQKYQNLPPAPHPLRGVMPGLGSLDVMASGSGWDNHIIDNIFSALVELNPDLEIVPDAAQRWEVLDGGRRYIFHLREDATWSDGVPVTAEDFEFAWKRVLDPASGADAEVINYFQHIKNALPFHEGKLSDSSAVGIHSRDDFTLEIELENPSGTFLYGLSIYNSYPVPRHSLQKFRDAWAEPENIVVNGPFKPAEWKTGEYLVLETNPAYHGVRSGNLQRVKMIFESSLGDVDALDLYEADRLDFHFRSQTRAHQRHPEEYRSNPFLMTAFISLDTRIAPLDNQRVRQALAMALDRERLVGEIYDGTQHPANGGYLPPGMPGHKEGIALPYDPEQARRLLAQAGYPDGRGFPKMIYLASIEGPPSQFEIFLRAQWRENLGVELARKRAFRVFSEIVQERLRQDKPNLWGAQRFAEAPDPSILLNEILTTETGWQNDEFKELLERARVTLDPDVRAGLYRQADAIVASELPIIPVYYGQFNLLVKPWVRRFPLSPTRGWHWKYVLIEPH
ncbi:MAG: ABC transporter substrate-binding protein, partial [Anaerolineales bacterium]